MDAFYDGVSRAKTISGRPGEQTALPRPKEDRLRSGVRLLLAPTRSPAVGAFLSKRRQIFAPSTGAPAIGNDFRPARSARLPPRPTRGTSRAAVSYQSRSRWSPPQPSSIHGGAIRFPADTGVGQRLRHRASEA